MFLQDLHTFAIHANINTQSFDKTYATFRDSVKLLNDILEQTRHGAMQRIAYLDSGTARILTIVATIFLPLAFLVALFSMPLQGAPLRRKKNAYWVFVYIILVIFVALVALFYRDFIALFKGSA
jgi:Mg2+ and Co2+ transporter CorA